MLKLSESKHVDWMVFISLQLDFRFDRMVYFFLRIVTAFIDLALSFLCFNLIILSLNFFKGLAFNLLNYNVEAELSFDS